MCDSSAMHRRQKFWPMPDNVIVRDADETLLAVVSGVPEDVDTRTVAEQVAPQGFKYVYRAPFTPAGAAITRYDSMMGNLFRIRLSPDGSVIVGFNGMTRRFTKEDFIKLVDKFDAAKERLNGKETE